jgi:hypothetical protein
MMFVAITARFVAAFARFGAASRPRIALLGCSGAGARPVARFLLFGRGTASSSRSRPGVLLPVPAVASRSRARLLIARSAAAAASTANFLRMAVVV